MSVCLWLALSVAACGKKAPPLAPLNMAPEAPQTITARRLGDTVYLQMTVPAKSALGKGPVSVDHLEVYAVTLAPGAIVPPNRDLLKPEHVIAKIEIQPPADPDAPPPATPDTRPGPGTVITFVETLTAAALTPQVITLPPKPPKPEKHPKTPPVTPPPSTVPAASAVPPPPAGPLVLTRMYAVRGVSSHRHAGTPSVRLEVPLLAAPGPARSGKTAWDETSVTVTWEPPASASDEAPGVQYNVYPVPAAGAPPVGVPVRAPVPLNTKPLDEQIFVHAGAVAGKEQCFVVRSVATVGTATIESDPTDPICVTPRDTFPPAAPTNLATVPGNGAINLIWNANTEPDLAGYLVLRGDAPGDTLQPLTPQPIRETTYRDTTVKSGVAYVYVVVAVDKATPPNRSAPSNRAQETAR